MEFVARTCKVKVSQQERRSACARTRYVLLQSGRNPLATQLPCEFLLKTDGGYPNCTSQFCPRGFPSRTLARIIFLPLSFCWDTPSLQTPPNLGSQDVPPRSTPPYDWISPCWKYKAAPLKVRFIVGTITGAIKTNHFSSYREVGQKKLPVFGETWRNCQESLPQKLELLLTGPQTKTDLYFFYIKKCAFQNISLISFELLTLLSFSTSPFFATIWSTSLKNVSNKRHY